MINITSTKNNEFYGAIRQVNYEYLIALALTEGASVPDKFAHLSADSSSHLTTSERRKGEVVQMLINAKLSGALLDSIPSTGPCEFDIPVCGGNFARWTEDVGAAKPSTFTTVTQSTYTFATLPTPAAGMTAFISDGSVVHAGNSGTVAAGGGANFVPVYYDGSDWRVA